jgi:hypothetical protein
MTTERIQCPACGSAEVGTRHERAEVQIPFAAPARYSERVDACATCGTEGDFTHENDAAIEAAVVAAEKASARELIDWLADNGTSMAQFERAFGLAARTLARWKLGEISASSLALLRVVRACPWLLTVAEEGFAEDAVRRELEGAAARSPEPMTWHLPEWTPDLLGRSPLFEKLRLSCSYWTHPRPNVFDGQLVGFERALQQLLGTGPATKRWAASASTDRGSVVRGASRIHFRVAAADAAASDADAVEDRTER